MKKLMYLFCFLAIGFTSCSDDDGDGTNADDGITSDDGIINDDTIPSDDGPVSTGNGELTLGSQSVDLKTAVVSYYGELYGDGLHNYDIDLLSSTVSFANGTWDLDDDIYTFVYFEVNTNNANSIPEGTYDFTGNDTDQNSFIFGDVVIECNINTGDGCDYIEFTSGTIEVSKSGSTYTINFSGETENENNVEVTYQGDVFYFDDTDESTGRMAKKSSSLRSYLTK